MRAGGRRARTLKGPKIRRIVSQALFFGLFLSIFIRSLDPFAVLENPFLRFDPLIFLTNPEAALAVAAGAAASSRSRRSFLKICEARCPAEPVAIRVFAT